MNEIVVKVLFINCDDEDIEMKCILKNVVKYLSHNLWWRYDEWCVEELFHRLLNEVWNKCWNKCWNEVCDVLKLSLTCH